MRKLFLLVSIALTLSGHLSHQGSGNTVYAQEIGSSVYAPRRPTRNDPTQGILYAIEPKESVTSPLIEASVLANVKADEYIAVFGLYQEGATVVDAARKMDAQTKEFTAGLKDLGITSDNVFVDFITQNKVYEFAGAGGVARERLAGFEIKKNVLVHYKDKLLLERMLAVAARAQVYDLIKVEYVVTNVQAVRARLLEEGAKVIRQKAEGYGKLFNMRLRPGMVYQEKYNAYYPSEMYNTYTAYETGSAEAGRVIEKRKTRTFYFQPLSASDFDQVINPLVVEPVVQFTLYLKVKGETSPAQ